MKQRRSAELSTGNRGLSAVTWNDGNPAWSVACAGTLSDFLHLLGNAKSLANTIKRVAIFCIFI
jgi:hypothetical protein